MNDIIPASHDVVFKALFVRNRELLRAFLREVLELPISDTDEIKILNPELIPETAGGKLSRLDIHVETAAQKFNIEMQARPYGFSAERVLYYWAKMYSDDIAAGEQYEGMRQSFSVCVLGFNMFERENYHSSYSIREDSCSEKLTDKLSIHIFELPKVPEELICDDKQSWMQLIKADTKEELEMLKTNTDNNAIRQGVSAIIEISADEALREQIRQRDKAIRDYNNDMATARAEGEAEGLIKGRAEGINDTKLETVRELLAEDFDLSFALKIAKLSEEEYKSLTKE